MNGPARRLAAALGRLIGSDQPTIEVYAYAIEVLLNGAFQIIVMLVLAWWLGILIPTVMVMLAFGTFRNLGGGVHLSGFWRCLITSTLMMLGLGWLGSVTWPGHYSYIIWGFALSLASLAIMAWVPAGTEKRPFDRPEIRRRMKKNTAITLVLWLAIALVLFFNHHAAVINPIAWGLAGAVFMLSPAGYCFIGWVDAAADHLLGRAEG